MDVVELYTFRHAAKRVECAGFSRCAATGKPRRLKPFRLVAFGGIASDALIRIFLKLHHYHDTSCLTGTPFRPKLAAFPNKAGRASLVNYLQ